MPASRGNQSVLSIEAATHKSCYAFLCPKEIAIFLLPCPLWAIGDLCGSSFFMKGIIVYTRVIDEDWSGEIAAVVIVPNDWQFKAEENCIITTSQENVLCKEWSGSARKTEV